MGLSLTYLPAFYAKTDEEKEGNLLKDLKITEFFFLLQMCVPTAIEESSGVSIVDTTNSLQLTQRGRYGTYIHT